MAAPDLIAWMLVLVRASGLLTTMPALSNSQVPRVVKIALAAMLAFLTVPLLPTRDFGVTALWELISLMLVELSIGLLFGFICRFTFFALEVAGSLIANDVGLTNAVAFNPASGGSLPVPSTLLYWMGVMLLFTLDLHHWVLAGFVRTYVILPPGGGHLSEDLLRHVLRHTGWILAAGLQIAAPVTAVSFTVTFVFSLLGRAVPQMNVFSESLPVRTLLGLSVFGMSLTFMSQHAANFLRRMPDDVLRVAKLLALQQ
jgi:flagellar biosynthesis protein FliR